MSIQRGDLTLLFCKFNMLNAQVSSSNTVHKSEPSQISSDQDFCPSVLTLICHELSHLTNLKFLPRLLLVQKHTLRILMAPPSPVKCASGLGSATLCLGLGTFQDKVSPNISSYIVTAGLAPSYPRHSCDRQRDREALTTV